MTGTALAGDQQRLLSLDVFRGLTIAAMVLVNSAGSWPPFAPLQHAPWDGWTPTDLVFPFFLFIVGVAMTFSFDRRIAEGADRVALPAHVVRRSAILIILGFSIDAFVGGKWFNLAAYALMIAGFYFVYLSEPVLSLGAPGRERRNKLIGWGLLTGGVLLFLATISEFGQQRIPGVLQRIAWCYFAVSLIMLLTTWKGRLVWTLLIINLYWLIMRYLDAPADYVMPRPDAPEDAPFRGRLNDWIDTMILGDFPWGYRPDPEGLLSTIPAMATVLLGALTGTWLKSAQSRADKAIGMFCAGGALIIIGMCMDTYFPINKKLWSSSFVVFTAGWALSVLAACYYLMDVKMWRRWSLPFLVFGTNAILLYWASNIVMFAAMYKITFEVDGETVSLRGWIYETLFASNIANPQLASLLFALGYVVLWGLILYPFYRKRIFLKV